MKKAERGDDTNLQNRGQYLLVRIVLLKPNKAMYDRAQIIILFRTKFKAKGKCCDLIIYSGSTENLVSFEMVENLGLKTTMHPNPYQVY